MKKTLFMMMLLLLLTDLSVAYNPPKESGDVLRRAMNSSWGDWFARLGHVAIYDKSNKKVLEVTDHSPTIRYNDVSEMTRNEYRGARYGRANIWQGKKAVREGWLQTRYRPQYKAYYQAYSEGGWGYTWKFKWNKGFYKSWHIKRAKFRCDTFINYCYKKGTGKHLVRRYTATPYLVHKAQSRRR